MSRPVTISNAQILDAARSLLLEEGVGVSTAAIARRAGVSEGTLFKRYASKDELVAAALAIPEPAWLRKLESLPGTGTLKGNLIALSLEILEFYRQITPTVITIWSAHLAQGRPAGRKAPPVAGIRAIARYFDREIELGRMRAGSTHVLARTLMGALHKQAFQEVLGVRDHDWPTPRAFVKELVELLWTGIAP